MMLSIAAIYAELILEGEKTIEQVPENLRDEVQAILAAEN